MEARANKLFHDFKIKHRKSIVLYILLNMAIFTLAAGLILLNLYTIRFNPLKGSSDPSARRTMWMFVLSSVFATISTFFSSLVAFFKYRQFVKESMKKIRDITTLRTDYENSVKQFEDPETRETILVDQVTEIINRPYY